MTTRNALRALTAAALVAATLILASCNGLGMGTGSVTLTVFNPNNSANGLAAYVNVYVDNKTLVATDIQAGQSATAKIDPGHHYMVYTFNYNITGGNQGSILHPGTDASDQFDVPSSATTYTWFGPTAP